MFKVRHNEETTNRTFRFPKWLMDKMSELAQQEDVSLNNFVVQCCEYAVENFEHSNTSKAKEDK